MFAKSILVSCNLPLLSHPNHSLQFQTKRPRIHKTNTPFLQSSTSSPSRLLQNHTAIKSLPFLRRVGFQICKTSLNSQEPEDPVAEKGVSLEENEIGGGSSSSNGGGDGEGRDWSSSVLLFGLWVGLIFYVFNLAPNQTPSIDLYFLKKLLNLEGDDGFKMNEVILALWYIMGLWPLVYSMLLLPTGRSSKSKIPVWPFLILSCFGGAYALIPYFVLWNPPPPPIEGADLGRWPLNFLESKLTAAVMMAAGLGLVIYSGLADGDTWREFFQYFSGSKFIHLTSIDFTLLSAFAPFWVYNDMTARKWYDKGSWLLPLSSVPFLGPCLYLLLRPSMSTLLVRPTSEENQ